MPTADAALAPPVAFHFTVSFGSTPPAVDGSFQEVSGIAPELETEPVAEGGENRFVHQLPKAMKNPRLTLKRGVAALDSQLVAWCRNVLEGGLVRPIVPKLLHVFLLDANGARYAPGPSPMPTRCAGRWSPSIRPKTNWRWRRSS